jgi:hypothetical protein
MSIPSQTAKQLRNVYFGGNWCSSSLKDQLADVSWQEATTKIGDLNTIAVLAFHVHYYVQGVTKVLQGGPLEIRDKFSLDCPGISSDADWNAMRERMWQEAQVFSDLIEQLPHDQLLQHFVDEKYGTYYRNLHGIIEHLHYHLGQIALLKKIIRNPFS